MFDSNEEMEKLASFTSKLASFEIKTAGRELKARKYLSTSEGVSAIALVMALRNLYGIECLYWEPETTWLTLDKDQITTSVCTREKIQAGLSVIKNPAFFWDNLVFQRTTQAFNDVVYDAEALQECQPAHMAWAVYEAALLRGIDPDTAETPEIDEDVQQYIAVCLYRAGFVYPPTILQVVANNLEDLYPKDTLGFIQQVKKSWEGLDKTKLRDRVFTESSLDVQLAQLASCYIYERERAAAMAADVLALERDL
jgi:hypothetical protein